MRSKKRIKQILKLIETIWNKYPDARFGQLILGATELDFNTDDTKLEQVLKERYMPNNKLCKKCNGTGGYMYDEIHGKLCEECCPHTNGWWILREHYGKNNGKFCCFSGCGYVLSSKAIEKLFHGKKVYHLYNNGVLWGITDTKKKASDIKKQLSPENKKVTKIQFGYYVPGG